MKLELLEFNPKTVQEIISAWETKQEFDLMLENFKNIDIDIDIFSKLINVVPMVAPNPKSNNYFNYIYKDSINTQENEDKS